MGYRPSGGPRVPRPPPPAVREAHAVIAAERALRGAIVLGMTDDAWDLAGAEYRRAMKAVRHGPPSGWAERPTWVKDADAWDRAVTEVADALGEPVPRAHNLSRPPTT